MTIKGIAWAMTTATLVTWIGVAMANDAAISALLARQMDDAQLSRVEFQPRPPAEFGRTPG